MNTVELLVTERLDDVNQRLETLYQYLIDNPETVTISDVREFIHGTERCAAYSTRLKRAIFNRKAAFEEHKA